MALLFSFLFITSAFAQIPSCPGPRCPRSYMCGLPDEALKYGFRCSAKDLADARVAALRGVRVIGHAGIPNCPGPRCPKEYMCGLPERAAEYGIDCSEFNSSERSSGKEVSERRGPNPRQRNRRVSGQ